MLSRRRFVQSSVAAALVPLLPKNALSTTAASTTSDLAIRQSWPEFAKGPYLQTFIDTIGTMRANKDETDPSSWYYWIRAHIDHCPHHLPYFLAWHRGLLKRFEGQLRKISGVSDMRLPYWNYYADPNIPAEFQVEQSPLWRSDRTSTDVTDALSLTPFGDDVVNFQRGSGNAFESKLENAPHNLVHDIVGGAMSNLTFSPADPLFYVHHANIDRLWAAWVAAGNGREMPPEDDPYWQGDALNYGPAVRTVPKVWTYSTTSTYLGYVYDDQSMPTALPGSYSTALARPASQSMQVLAPRQIDAKTTSLGGAGQFVLDERSTTFDIPMSAQSTNHVRSLMIRPSSVAGTQAPLELVLDDVRLTGLGEEGGFFYKILLNLPDHGASPGQESAYQVGVIGPFEISVAQMSERMAKGLPMDGSGDAHGKGPLHVSLRFPVMDALRRNWPVNLDRVSVSLVRVGRRGRAGPTIKVGQMRLEALDSR